MVVGVLVDERMLCHQLVVRPNKHSTVVSDPHGRKFMQACTPEPPLAMLRIWELADPPDPVYAPFAIPHTFTPRLLCVPFLVVHSDGTKLSVSQFHDMWKTALATATTVLRRIDRLQSHNVTLPLFRLHIQPGTLAVTAQKLNKKDGSTGEGSVRGKSSGPRKGATPATGQGREKGGASGGGSKRGGRKRGEKQADVSDEEESEKQKEEEEEEDENDRDDAASAEEEEDDDNAENEHDEDEGEQDDDEDDRDEDEEAEDDDEGDGADDVDDEEEEDDDATFDDLKEAGEAVQPEAAAPVKRAKRGS